MSESRILVLDDEPDMLDNCQRMLASAGYECVGTTDPREALRMLGADHPDLFLTDLRMPEVDGMEMLERARQLDPLIPVVMLTGYATVETAVAAVKAGAFDYLSKPFSLDQLRVSIDRALNQRKLELENLHLREQLPAPAHFENIAGQSLALRQALELVRKAARSEANILIAGESGTGKELIASAIHANSSRTNLPFVPVDCASLPENLLESELFGHEKGSFTGAAATKRGLIETAHRGTLFLDELGELPLGLQAKLLRVLQERQIRRVGGTAFIEVDIRLVAATNRNLAAMVAAGMFREDLYYRVNVVDVIVPPLRERAGDIELLAVSFLKKYSHGSIKGFSAESVLALEAYPWPGNVRELQNVVERACALAEGELITVAELPEQVRTVLPLEERPVPDAASGLTLREAKERWVGGREAAYLIQMLKDEDGNVSRAARRAGIDRKTFHRLLNKHSLR